MHRGIQNANSNVPVTAWWGALASTLARAARRDLIPPCFIFAFAGLLFAFAGSPATAADAPPKIEARDIREALSLYNRNAQDAIPLLEAEQITKLLEGEIVKVRQAPSSPDLPQGVAGYAVFDVPRVQVWIAATDPHAGYSGGMLSETRLAKDTESGSIWYQHLKLPWPVQDRHWLIRIRRESALSRATDNRIWVHSWALDEKGEPFVKQFIQAGHIRNVSLEVAEKSLYTPVNHGSWITWTMPGNRTFLVYRVTSVVGGNIPDNFVVEWAMLTLGNLLNDVGEFSRRIPQHYVDGHEVVLDANGVEIPWFDAAK